MGIPKFFRYISERWPLILQLIEGNHIPEFDNLYLDMNSILHTCTHGNSDDVTRRMSEEEVFAKIFAYIDHLFHTIKPKQIFYMAIDGVAPRAKMNQQRARRFRTAMDAEKALEKAIANGDEIPKGEPFDSNAITPGTEFMAKLTKHLQYFIHDKITNDSKWREVKIIFSGHEVPGEGEHKIMDFIRGLRADDSFDPNTRHCIYGLDADLIMLGLSVHAPHFALLREEVVFGRRSSTQASLENQNFYLLHLSLLREYMQLEFEEIADELKFEYNFERILDDFILVMFVIGNDFLPNLPDLHLNKGAFPVILQTFKEALQHLDGYINDNGHINLGRLKVWLQYLSQFELMNFERSDVDVDWFNQQLENISLEGEKQRARTGKKILLKQQKKIVGLVKPWITKVMSQKCSPNLSEDDIPTLLIDDDRIKDNLDFLKEFAFQLGLFVTHSRSTDKYSLKLDVDAINPHETEQECDERQRSVRKTLKMYQQAVLVEDQEELDTEKETYNERFVQWKDNYYRDKFGFSINDSEKLADLTGNYVEGLQWVLYYYYRGCASWGWYYHYHYAPRISDLEKGLDQLIEFEKGKPFTPFQQLMAVLPERSKELIPSVFRPLMYDEKSPIKDFYPREVQLDKNGKTADWEAVVLISFVDQDRLIEAMEPYLPRLTPEEKSRNSRGSDLIFTYNPQVDEVYKCPLSGIFSDIEHNHCVEREFVRPDFKQSQFRYGLLAKSKVGADMLAGFPSLRTVTFTSELLYNETRVFQQPSKQQSMVLTIDDVYKARDLGLDELAERYLGNVVYTRWPFLRESKLVSIRDRSHAKEISDKSSKPFSRQLNDSEKREFSTLAASMVRKYSSAKATSLKEVTIIVAVLPVTDLIRTPQGAYVKAFASEPEHYPLQLMVEEVANVDERYVEREPVSIEEEFPESSHVIFLGDYAYGEEAIIDGYSSDTRLKLTVHKKSRRSEPIIGKERAAMDRSMVKYFPSFVVAKKLNLHPLFLSKITSRFLVANQSGKNINVGVPIKFEGRHEKVLGYARRNPKGWEYSTLAIQLLEEYKRLFPDFFKRLSANRSNMPTIQELFPELPTQKAADILPNVTNWLKSVTEKFVTVSLESDSLTKVSIQAVEDHVQKHSGHPDETERKQLAKVPCKAVLDPKKSFTLLRTQRFELGDRVVYIQDSGKIPLFSKGTVVGYTTLGTNLSIQVLFDHEIVAGNNFGGRLRSNRGIGLDASFLLNITDRQFIYHSKASKQTYKERSAQQKAKSNLDKSGARAAKKNRAHDLLNHIKKADNTQTAKKDEKREVLNSEDSRQTAGGIGSNPVDSSEFIHETDQRTTSVANNIYHSVLNQYVPSGYLPQNMQFQSEVASVPAPSGLPYHLPPGILHPAGIPLPGADVQLPRPFNGQLPQISHSQPPQSAADNDANSKNLNVVLNSAIEKRASRNKKPEATSNGKKNGRQGSRATAQQKPRID